MTNEEIKNITLESLRDWFKKEKWVRITTSGNIAGPCGTSKNKKNPDRCLPRAKAQSLTKAQRAATARKKKKAGAKGKTVVKNTKKATVRKENLDKVSGGIPYRIEGNKAIISMPLPDDAKERIIRRAKKHGYNAKPNMGGGVTIFKETANPQDGKAAPYGSGFKPINMTRKQIEELVWEVVTEKDDRCTRIAKRKYDTWPSAYASGAVVRCRRGEIWKGQK